MIHRLPLPSALLALLIFTSCAQERAPTQEIEAESLLRHVEVLSADDMEGREAGSEGGVQARQYVLEQFQSAGVVPCGDDFEWPFSFATGAGADSVRGVNIVGVVEGRGDSDLRLVVTGHYDHVGVREGQIYNGADDNASGTSVVIELARYFAVNRPQHTMVFAALDAEEKGLRGARAFLASDCAAQAPVALNVNLDMVSRSEEGELYAAGTYHYPFLKPILEQVPHHDSLAVLFGHDEPGSGSDDWTSASDHGPFHSRGIPFVYFGVEDHPGYHQPGDDFAYITPGFYHRAAQFILHSIQALDRNLESIANATTPADNPR